MASQSIQQVIQPSLANFPALALIDEIPDFQISNPAVDFTNPPNIFVSGQVTIDDLSVFGFPACITDLFGDHTTEINVKITPNLQAKSVTITLQPSDFNIPLPLGGNLPFDDPSFSITLITPKPYTISYVASGVIPISLPYASESFSTNATLTLLTQGGKLSSATVGLVVTPAPPLGLPSVLDSLLTVNQISLEMGMVYNPDYCKVGIGADVTWKIPSGSDPTDFMIVCDVVGDAFIPQYIAFSADSIALSGILSSIIPGINSSFPNLLQLTNPSFWWCDNPTTLPDGSTVKKGFGFHSELELFGFTCYGSLYYQNNTNLAGSFQSKGAISLADGVFTLSGNGAPVPALSGNNNSSILTTAAEVTQYNNNAAAKDNPPQWPGNGVQFSLSLQHSPAIPINNQLIISGDGKATFLDVVSASLNVKAAIIEDIVQDYYLEIDFDFDAGISVTEAFTLQNSTLNGSISFQIGQVITLLSQDSFLVNLQASNKIAAAISVSETALSMDLTLEIEGATFNFSSGSLTDCTSIADLMEAAAKVISDNAATIAADLAANPGFWVNAITSGAFGFVAEKDLAMGAVDLLTALHVPYGKQMGQYLGQMQQTLNYTVSDVQNAMTSISKTIQVPFWNKAFPGATLSAMGQEFFGKFVGDPSNQSLLKLYQEYSPQSVAQFMQTSLGAGATDVALAFSEADIPVDEAASALKDVYNLTKDTVGNLLDLSGYPKDVIDKLSGYGKDIYNWIKGL